MHIDPILSKFVILSLTIILAGFLFRVLKQPTLLTYIIVGLLLGPNGFKVITDESIVTNLGSLGLVLLLFFIGMEISLPRLITNWRISVIGTLLQVIVTILAIFLAGKYFDLEIRQVVFWGFVLSLSSTAVIVKLLDERKEINSRIGQVVLGILLVQDLLIVPMLIVIGYMGGELPKTPELIKQLVGGLLIIGVILLILIRKQIKLPFKKYITKDHELQVFVAFTLCFGFSVITAILGLSAALGAFVAGMLVSSAKSTEWVYQSLLSFKVMFVALFFVSIGMLIDLNFIAANYHIIILMTIIVFTINNIINTLVIKAFGMSWGESIYGGALLAQIGEFSFIIGSTGFLAGIIGQYSYELIINIIAISLMLSTFWIYTIHSFVKKRIA
ncbi:MAG: hypothetical protein AMS27_05645 [Bacteroides sp. SM23_62_1]|nr:MAG: hypothetical protein AMS27_05645 [Bacteroides sp. SM23_62_1]